MGHIKNEFFNHILIHSSSLNKIVKEQNENY